MNRFSYTVDWHPFMFCLRIALWLGVSLWMNALGEATFGQTSEPNRKDEPLAESFSMEKAIAFTDVAASNWQADHNCVTCHTNGLYLVARAMTDPESPKLDDARSYAADYLAAFIDEGQTTRGQRGSVEGIVATTAYLAISEQLASGGLNDSTKRYLEHIWTLQNEAGCWDWLKCNWPPFEVDDHYGATLVAIACGETGAENFESEAVTSGVRRLRQYLNDVPPANLHQKAMMLWAAHSFDGIADTDKKTIWIREIVELQQADGGWSTAELGSGSWKRSDKTPQDQGSDAYATSLAVFALHRAGVSIEDPGLQRGIAWLKCNQRKSGRWFVRSLHSDNRHYISHAATNMALMALSLEDQATVPDSDGTPEAVRRRQSRK